MAASVRMMDGSSIVPVPMPINIFGYDIEVVMLEKMDFTDFIDRKEIGQHVSLCIWSESLMYTFLRIKQQKFYT